MSRNFPDWISAYQAYAEDSFCPSQFHLWTGLSLLAGAVERKVWLNNGKMQLYPNIYVLLVSHAGTGKSTALERGIDLLEALKENHSPELMVIPTQITEPALLDLMKIRRAMEFGTTIVYHSSGYFYASEASASALQNLFGDFNATICALYDCPKVFRKKIKSEKEVMEVTNACFNLLAGATFNYLNNIVNEKTIMGGLASRFTYVIEKNRKVRESKWDEFPEVDRKTRALLLEDLEQIHRLQGRFTPTPGFIAAWEKKMPEFDQALIDLGSERLESLLVRKPTTMLKLCMLMSLSEGSSLTLTEAHWERALVLLEEVTKDYAFILSQAAIADKQSQNGVNQMILQTLRRNNGEMPMPLLKRLVMSNGNAVESISQTIDFMIGAGSLSYDGNGKVKLLIDADGQL